MSEILVLDPPEVSYNRAALDITTFVAEQGPDFGDAAIEQVMAEGYRGQIPVDFKVPNRIISIPLVLRDVTGRSFDQIREFIQAKVGLFQREGGWFKRQLTSGVVYADVVSATLHYGGSTAQAILFTDADAVLTLECLPDFYGDEIALGLHAETTLPELVFTETGIKGDFPARVRLVVDEDQGVSQHGLLWGMRARHYSPDSTARLAYRATTLTPLDAASASSGVAVTHGTIGKTWTPVLGTALGGSHLTHTGTYRVFARVLSGIGGADLRCRLVWDVGDLTNPTVNRPYTFPTPNRGYFYIADLGEVRIDAAPAGTHRWVGQVEAYAVNDGAASFAVSDVWFQPVDDGCGLLAATSATSSSFTSYVSRDEFNQGFAPLAGATMGSGGSWSGAGSGTDFATAGGGAVRSATSDPSDWAGRYAIAGNNPLALSTVRAVFYHGALTTAGSGVFLRYTPGGDWLMAVVFANPLITYFEVVKRVAGTVTRIGGFDAPYPLAAQATYILELTADTDGSFQMNFGVGGQPVYPYAEGSDSDLATGGPLAIGRQGIYDVNTSALANGRIYDYFAVWVPTQDAVLFANQTLELTYSGMYRQAVTGGSYGPVSRVSGDLPRLPPSGLEARPIEVLVKATRGDLFQTADSYANNLIADNISARLFYRPSWLFVPESGLGPPVTTGLFPAITLFTGPSDQPRQSQAPAPDLYPQF